MLTLKTTSTPTAIRKTITLMFCKVLQIIFLQKGIAGRLSKTERLLNTLCRTSEEVSVRRHTPENEGVCLAVQ